MVSASVQPNWVPIHDAIEHISRIAGGNPFLLLVEELSAGTVEARGSLSFLWRDTAAIPAGVWRGVLHFLASEHPSQEIREHAVIHPGPWYWAEVRRADIEHLWPVLPETPSGIRTNAAQKAEDQFKDWFRRQPEYPVRTKADVRVEADNLVKPHILSGRAFDRVWASEAPKTWKKPGPRSR